MSHLQITGWFYLTCLGAALTGCQSSDSADILADELPAVVVTPAVNEPGDSNSTPDLAVTEASQDAATPLTKVAAPFSPPFPDRMELFEPPKRASGSVRRDDEHGESVELKGFVNVDQPRAVLSIDGVISPVAEGGEKYGVQVISIQPPSVVLQRGRSRWTATLE
ncbi:MAG: hypothetical protein WD468_12060 [Pirellulales bacterium]